MMVSGNSGDFLSANSASVKAVANSHSVDISALEKAASLSETLKADLKRYLSDSLQGKAFPGLDVIVTGSIARSEATAGSDCDFLLLVDTTQTHDTLVQLIAIMRDNIEFNQLKGPGIQAVFGDFTTATELLGRVGLQSDSNTNMTRRMSIITESVSLMNPNVRAEIIRKIMQRYAADYMPSRRTESFRVPRFLVNDLIRFWRTMGVDFAAKRSQTMSEDWYLRYIKLLTSRKLLFAGTLMSLLLTDFILKTAPDDIAGRYEELIEFLCAVSERTPLARLMVAYDHLSEPGKRALADILRDYNSFIELLNSSRKEGAKAAHHKAELDKLAETIQNSLETVFFKDSKIAKLADRYTVF
jgi:hypothetical protein